MGKSGSGKDYIYSLARAADIFSPVIRTTTRPMREKEVQDFTYHFISGEEYGKKFLNFDFIEVGTFRDWFYGTDKTALSEDKINIGVFDPAAVEQILANKEIETKVIYIHASAKQRLLRSLNREENPDVEEIIRRYKADEEDFMGIEDDINCKVFDNNTMADADNIVKFILSLGQNWSI